MIDVHTHVLPNVDDGSKSVKESVAMLRVIRKTGIDIVVATPHFYAHKESIAQFLVRREKSMYRLEEQLYTCEPLSVPQLILGAEVYYFTGISKVKGLEKLVMEGTNILLLEMPFTEWNSEMLREIEEIQSHRKLRIMIAHIERYMNIRKNRKYIEELFESDVLIQISTSALLDWRMKRRMIRLIRQKQVHALGSDAHNMRTRKPNWDKVIPIIKKAELCMMIDREF